MIGMFDRDTINDHEDKFKHGKLPLRDFKVDKREIQFTDVDCAAQQLEQVAEDDDFDEILQEILEEERQRKAAEEAASGGSKKGGGKKGKGKKGKKKKKSSFTSDEL